MDLPADWYVLVKSTVSSGGVWQNQGVESVGRAKGRVQGYKKKNPVQRTGARGPGPRSGRTGSKALGVADLHRMKGPVP